MWQIAARQRPYEGAVPDVIEGCVRNGERAEPVEGCPNGYMELVQRCWDHDPFKRPHMDEVLDELSKIKKGVLLVGDS